MKKSGTQKLTALLLSLLVAFTIILIPQIPETRADGSTVLQDMIKFKNGKTYNLINEIYDVDMGSMLDNATKVRVTSTNKSVVDLLEDSEYNFEYGLVSLETKKKGSATVRIKVTKKSGTKTYKIKVKVTKYANPFKSIKIGRTSVTKRFKKSPYAPANAGTGSKKVAIKMADGWTIKKISLRTFDYAKSKTTNKTIKNNSTIKIKKGEDWSQELFITVYNKKTKTTVKCICFL